MEKYLFLREVGKGSYGSVWKAMRKQSGEVVQPGEIVAIKILKKQYQSMQECMNLREVKALVKLMKHPNIVKLKEVTREKNLLFLVFEFMECNLHQLMKGRKQYFPEAEIKNWCFQVLQGLAYMHHYGYFHRDLKPENLLFSKGVIKIADFGLAREFDSNPPYTEYVGTRWYRAPEVMLRSEMYGSKIDMWAMGAIMAELFSLMPLFPGTSEADEMYKICKVIGSPSEDSWADGLNLARSINYQFPQHSGVPLSMLMPSASEYAINLIGSLCSWDPCKRPTAAEALQHPFFMSCFYIPRQLYSIFAVTRILPPVDTKRSDLKLHSDCICPQLYTSTCTCDQCKQDYEDSFEKWQCLPVDTKRSDLKLHSDCICPQLYTSTCTCDQCKQDYEDSFEKWQCLPVDTKRSDLKLHSDCICPQLYTSTCTCDQCKQDYEDSFEKWQCLPVDTKRSDLKLHSDCICPQLYTSTCTCDQCKQDYEDSFEKWQCLPVDTKRSDLELNSNCICPQLYTSTCTCDQCKQDYEDSTEKWQYVGQLILPLPPPMGGGVQWNLF